MLTTLNSKFYPKLAAKFQVIKVPERQRKATKKARLMGFLGEWREEGAACI